MIQERYMGCDWIVIASFFVSGIPKAQPRVRRSKFGGVYTPDSADVWKDAIAWQAKAFKPKQPLECPVRVWWDAYFPRPKRLLKKSDPEGPIEHTAKPDRDNLDKAILDTMKSLGFFLDDALVCGGELRKYYTAKPGYGSFETPGCHIFVERKALPEDTLTKGAPHEEVQPPRRPQSRRRRSSVVPCQGAN